MGLKLIVGLGNPGRKYARTRHNIGFEVLDEIERKFAGGMRRSKFDGEYVEAQLHGQRALLLWPHTFMNNSGNCVQPIRDFYKIENADILVVSDDISMPVAKLRFRAKGSSGGQKGLKDILQRLGTEEIARLRIGIGSPFPGQDAADFVLSRFGESEVESVLQAIKQAAEASAEWVRSGIDHCMNQYNAN